MLRQLSKKQISLTNKIKNKWINLAFTPKKLNHQKLIEGYQWLYDFCKIGTKPTVIIVKSPLEVQIASNIIRQILQKASRVQLQVESQVLSQIWSQIRSQVWSQIKSQVLSYVWAEIWSQIQLQVESQVESQVRSQLESQVCMQVWSQVRSQVCLQVWSQVQSQVELQVWSQVQSQVELQVWSQMYNPQRRYYFPPCESSLTSEPWISFYDYFTEIGLLKHKNFNKYRDLLQECPWSVVLLKNFVILCGPPTKQVLRNERGQVHNPHGPAYEWENGEKYYVLNGVGVPEWVVMKPIKEITSKDIFSLKDVDQRRELITRIGIHEFIKKSKAKSIDIQYLRGPQWHQELKYELLELDLSDRLKNQKYLKMQNPSIEAWHIEGVDNSCQIVMDALHFRKPEDLKKLPISNKGSDWYQQGDVCIWPDNAQSIKPLPKILT